MANIPTSVNFEVDRDDLIKLALLNLVVVDEEDDPSPTQYSQGAQYLNLLAKMWQSDGLQLWASKYGYILPTTGVSSVAIGKIAAGGSAHAVSSYVYTTTSAAASSGASTITVTSITGISASDVIGIELSSGSMQWTTVNGAPSGSTVTLTATLTGNVASGAAVYTYASSALIDRPLKIYEAFRRKSSDNIDTPLVMLTNQEYNNLSSKTTATVPVQWYYDPQINSSTNEYPGAGNFYVWPRFNNGDDVIVIRYQRPFADFDASTDTPDFPQEWFLPLLWGLTALLAAKNGVTLEERKLLWQEANMLKDQVKTWDQEVGSVYIQPQRRWTR